MMENTDQKTEGRRKGRRKVDLSQFCSWEMGRGGPNPRGRLAHFLSCKLQEQVWLHWTVRVRSQDATLMQVADLRADVSESWHGTTSTEELLIYLLLHVYCCSGATSDGRRLLRNECNTCGLLMQRTVGGALRYGRRHAWVIGATYNLKVKVPPMPVPGLLRGRYTRSSPNKYPFRYMWALGRV